MNKDICIGLILGIIGFYFLAQAGLNFRNAHKFKKRKNVYNTNHDVSSASDKAQESDHRKNVDGEIEPDKIRVIHLSALTPENVVRLEQVPAYKRRKVELESHTSIQEIGTISRWIVADEDEENLGSGNTFLHDSVD